MANNSDSAKLAPNKFRFIMIKEPNTQKPTRETDDCPSLRTIDSSHDVGGSKKQKTAAKKKPISANVISYGNASKANRN